MDDKTSMLGMNFETSCSFKKSMTGERYTNILHLNRILITFQKSSFV